MKLAWVLGARGLLGSALCRALSAEGMTVFVPGEFFSWTDAQKLAAQISAAVNEYAAAASQALYWEIYWAAGVGTMSSTCESLAPETKALEILLQCIRADTRLMAIDGTIVFASSAGAIYASCADDVITEESVPTPTNAYARAKLSQENLLRDFCASGPRQFGLLLARISTLYGVGQAIGKPQGLLTHMARSIVRNKPIGIYVPIDTIRDYIAADDAASEIVETVRVNLEMRPHVMMRIIASGTPTTIAEIISIFKRVARKSPKITTSASAASSAYARRVQFRSNISLEPRPAMVRGLVVGISQLLEAERFEYANPRLATRK